MRAPAKGAVAAALLLALPAWAQSLPVRVQARLDSSLTVSDQIDRLPGGGADGGAVLSVTPGVSLAARGAQLDARADYGLNLLVPWRLARDPQQFQHNLNARAGFRPADSGFSLTGSASISQQQQSAFGVQRASTGAISLNPRNQAEVYRLDLGPSYEARLGSLAALTVSHRLGLSNTKDSVVGDSQNRSTSVVLGSPTRGPLNWDLRLEHSETRPKAGRATDIESARIGARWVPDIDWELGLSAGRERSNLQTTGQRESGEVYGARVGWRPGPRTRLEIAGDRRVFGNTYTLGFDHRFARANIRLNESRNLSQPGVVGASSGRTYYELLFAQLASVEPDPALRDLLVLAQLQQQGLRPDAIATTGAIVGRSSLTRMSMAAGSYQTRRSTWSFTASRSRSSRLGLANDGPADDFSNTGLLETTGASLAVAYRLAPLDSLNLSLTWQRNRGDRVALQTSFKTASLAWSTRLAPRQQVSVSFRHSVFDSLLEPYDENALVLSFQHQF